MRAGAGLRQAGRALALAATALALAATSLPPCFPADRGTFQADTTCGPPGVVILAFDDAGFATCSGGCWAFVDARGAGAVGLPEQGETSPASPPSGTLEPPPGTILASSWIVLVGDVPLPGSGATVRRTCRAHASPTEGVLEVACGGEAPEAACAGTLTLLPPVP